jgi:hypothetical protein
VERRVVSKHFDISSQVNTEETVRGSGRTTGVGLVEVYNIQ